MSFNFGQFNEFTDENSFGDPTILVVAKVIELGPFKGAFYQGMGPVETTLQQKQFDIYSRSKTCRDGAIGDGEGTGWDNSATADLAMPADVLKGLTIGHVLQVEDEVVIIKAVDRSANNIDVYARGAGSTSAAAHDDETAFMVIGYAGNDTDLKNVESMSEGTNVFSNYVQTVFEAIDWTKHATLVRKGMSAANATFLLVQEAEIRVAEMLSRMSVLGIKQKAASNDDRYMSAGLIPQLKDTNGGKRVPLSKAVDGNLTEALVQAAIKEVFDNGGTVNTLWCSTRNKGYINAFNMANSDLAINANKSDHVAGTYITHIDYEGHLIQVRVDVDMPDSTIPIVNQADCKKGWLVDDGLTLKDEPSQSSREFRKSIQGSVGFLVENVGVNHTILTGITGGTSERVSKVNIVNTGLTVTVDNDSENPVATQEVV